MLFTVFQVSSFSSLLSALRLTESIISGKANPHFSHSPHTPSGPNRLADTLLLYSLPPSPSAIAKCNEKLSNRVVAKTNPSHDDAQDKVASIRDTHTRRQTVKNAGQPRVTGHIKRRAGK